MEKDQLKRIINYCELSYKHPSDVDINAFIFLEDKKTDAQCYIFYDYQTAYITFRGTSSLKDWMADLKCSTVSPDIYKDVRIQVHSGFYDQYASLRKDIILKILHLQYMYKIYLAVVKTLIEASNKKINNTTIIPLTIPTTQQFALPSCL